MIRKNLVYLLGLLIALLLTVPTVSAQGWHSQSMTSAVKRSAGKSPSKSRDASSKQYAGKGARNSKAAGSKESSKTAESKKSVESSQPTSTSSGKTKTESSSKSSTASTSTRERTVTKTGHNKTTGRCDPEKHQLSDLSGTYHGVVNYPDGGFNGDATLTITGNQFLLVVGNAAQTGRITAVTTCSYTAATMMFGESKSAEPGKPAPPPLPVISLRATKKANDLVLATIEGERRTFSFAPKATK